MKQQIDFIDIENLYLTLEKNGEFFEYSTDWFENESHVIAEFLYESFEKIFIHNVNGNYSILVSTDDEEFDRVIKLASEKLNKQTIGNLSLYEAFFSGIDMSGIGNLVEDYRYLKKEYEELDNKYCELEQKCDDLKDELKEAEREIENRDDLIEDLENEISELQEQENSGSKYRP